MSACQATAVHNDILPTEPGLRVIDQDVDRLVLLHPAWLLPALEGLLLGPVSRANATRIYPDFQFVQMTSPHLAPPGWEPAFGDYLYLSFTKAAAFSPTDVMPLSRWAKMAMTVQASVSIVTVALVVARAVNILR
jgi:hypothetical protein